MAGGLMLHETEAVINHTCSGPSSVESAWVNSNST